MSGGTSQVARSMRCPTNRTGGQPAPMAAGTTSLAARWRRSTHRHRRTTQTTTTRSGGGPTPQHPAPQRTAQRSAARLTWPESHSVRPAELCSLNSALCSFSACSACSAADSPEPEPAAAVPAPLRRASWSAARTVRAWLTCRSTQHAASRGRAAGRKEGGWGGTDPLCGEGWQGRHVFDTSAPRAVQMPRLGCATHPLRLYQPSGMPPVPTPNESDGVAVGRGQQGTQALIVVCGVRPQSHSGGSKGFNEGRVLLLPQRTQVVRPYGQAPD